MISIVIVSHSRPLAAAAVALAGEMVSGQSRPMIAVAAGLDETTFGTDAAAVAAAIAEVDSPEGVLVLLDLGSAVLSAEMAVELLEPGIAGRVTVTSAPLVEGLVAAVVMASTGAPMPDVVDEACRGLAAKQEHLGDAPRAAEPAASPDTDTAATEVTADLEVTNKHGMHARPAAKVVSLVRGYDARVTLANLDSGRGPVDAASLSRVATLDARQGHTLHVSAVGPDADEVVGALSALAARAFDDDDASGDANPSGPNRPAVGSGLDLAMGPALVRRAAVDTTAYESKDVAIERRRSRDAAATVRLRLEGLERRTTGESGVAAGAIFAAQLALLDDAAIIDGVDAEIFGGTPAVTAWRERLDVVAREFESLADGYQRERAADVRSVQQGVLRALMGHADADDEAGPGVEEPVILVVDELDAATAASIAPDRVAGIAVVARGTTGHGVIVASSRGIPLLTGAGDDAAGVRTGQVVAFDARLGVFWPKIGTEEQGRFPVLVAARERERVEAVEAAQAVAVTSDGRQVPVLANVASVADAEAARAAGADGSGLVRTEVLFGDRDVAPTVDDQVESFLALANALEGAPLTIRTWDAGGDKPLRFLPQVAEANPFLGERGIRVFRDRPSLLIDQLAAICLAARETPIRVMFPMVTDRAEVDSLLTRLRQAGKRTTGGVPSGLQVGIMVEVPAAALMVETLAGGLDFVSIGTNDLTQYTVAADRGNDAVAEFADPLTPAVLRLIDRVCCKRPDGVDVAVCGDLASSPVAAPLLLGLGVTELSCAVPRVPYVKAAIRETDLGAAQTLAAEALTASAAALVRSLLAERAKEAPTAAAPSLEVCG